MFRKLLSLIIVILSVTAFSRAQVSEETFPVKNSALTRAALPTGALQVREENVPAEIKETLAKLIQESGAQIRQGDSEVLLWTEANYKKSGAGALIKKIETNLQTAGWIYEIAEKTDELVIFALMRETPERRGMLGFIIPSDDALIFAVTEMLRADGDEAVIENDFETPEKSKSKPRVSGGAGDSSIYGKWHRTEGSGSIDPTGKTRYKSGRDYYFEFFADGTVEYASETDVLSIMQCVIKGADKARGRYSIKGNTLIINLGPTNSVGSDSCDSKGNFKKTLPASETSVSFEIRKMESITRPDNPVILCFNGETDDQACFEKVK